MKLSNENAVKLKAFHAAENLFELGKLMHELNKKKVPYTELGKAVGVTDYIAKSYIKSFKANNETAQATKIEEKTLSTELARVQKVAEQNGAFADAMKLHIKRGFDKFAEQHNVQYEITLIEIVGAFFRVGINAKSFQMNTSNHFVEYVNFDVDFEPLVKLWSAVLNADFVTGESVC